MLEYHRGVDPSTLQDHPRLAQPPTTGVRNWRRRDERQRDVERFEAIAGGPRLAELGYPRAVPAPSRRGPRARRARGRPRFGRAWPRGGRRPCARPPLAGVAAAPGLHPPDLARKAAPGVGSAGQGEGYHPGNVSTVIVTGGAGFLGSHLCDYLLADGHRVICVDNLDTGSLQNIEHIRDGRFEFVNHDLTEPLFLDEPVDVVFHLASPASPIDYLRLPLHTLKVGSYGTHHMLGVAKFKRARFLLASTSEVYGDPQVHPQPETYWGHVNPIGPRGRLRRGEALRGGADDGVPPPAGRGHVHRAHLQHVRAAHAPARRARHPDASCARRSRASR